MQFKRDFLSNIKADSLAGLVVALALIPEAIAFSIIAGVSPKVGLYAAFSMALITAFVGGRPAMVSAATGAMALLIVDLVKDHGLDYMLAATVLTGIIQIVAGWIGIFKLMRFVSKSVMVGFVNALAILIFMAQLPELIGVNYWVYILVIAGLAIIYLLPYLTKAVPSPLVAIVGLTILSIVLDLDVRRVGDMGELPDSLPTFLLPNIPLNFETLKIIFPYAIGLSVVGLLESLMTANIVDELTDTKSSKKQECFGQGVGNIVTGFLGGMAGCAMIGQSVINVKSGGRGRLSSLAAAVGLLIMVVFLDQWVAQIPMAALVAVMIMVSIGTFNFNSILTLHKNPKSSTIVMLSTVIVVVFTHDLSKGVLVGVLFSAFFFAQKISRILFVDSEYKEEQNLRHYYVKGQVFFASADSFYQSFDFKEVVDNIVIDLNHAHFWDLSAVGALDKVVLKFRREGCKVEIIGLNKASQAMLNKFAQHDKKNYSLDLH